MMSAMTALFAAAAGVACLTLPFLQWPVHISYDLPFCVHRPIAVNDVVIIYMDEHSESVLGQGRWDRWDRAIHARLLRKLREAGAKAVVFDILFAGPGANANSDKELVEAARNFGKVAVAAKNSFRIHEGEIIGSELTKPFDQLAIVSQWGMVEASDANKAVREHYRDTVFEIPSLAWRAAELTSAAPAGGPFAERWVNFYGAPGYLPHLSYSDVFENNFNAVSAFSNKVVFVGGLWSIGFTGGKGTDDFRTPYTLWTGRKSPGVEINATTFLNLVRGDWLTRLKPAFETSLVVLFAVAVALCFLSLRPLTATGVAIAFALCIGVVGILCVWTMRVWFPWMVPAAVQIPSALAGAIIIHTRRLHREVNLLEQELALAHASGSPKRFGTTPPGVRPALPRRAPADGAPVSVRSNEEAPRVPDHELLRRVGKGGYGEVWLARDIIGSYHAIKIVYRQEFNDEGPYEREFRGLSRFTPISRSHPGFVHVLHVGRSDQDDYIYYVMELGDDKNNGQNIDPATYSPKTLLSELRQRRRLPLTECLDITIHLADTLQHLHQQNLIHRDIKPANIIFVKGIPKLADIGLVTDAATAEAKATYLGTKGYIAPEGPGTAMADIYSLGKLTYEIGFGLNVDEYPKLPTDMIENPGSAALFSLNRVILKACHAQADQRYATAAAFHDALVELRQQRAHMT